MCWELYFNALLANVKESTGQVQESLVDIVLSTKSEQNQHYLYVPALYLGGDGTMRGDRPSCQMFAPRSILDL